MEKVDTTVLKDRVYESTREQIVNGTITPGMALSETALATELKVSRTPVREAIRQLAAEGFVEIKPRCGGKVLRPTPELAREVFQIREALEGIAAREAASRADPNDVRAMREKFQQIRQAIAQGDLSDVGDDIHAFIFESAGNARLYRLMSVYQAQVEWLQREASLVPGRLEAAFREHDAILGALESCAPEWAEAASRAHVRNTLTELLESAFQPESGPKQRARRPQ